mmetsp:Transcript_19814/g.33824  ORF Transcript_19814/g.33824 Transcript_19814/m.33824 type:complete len:529 (-) Transcript_19814:351-1937(-)
MTPRTPDLLLPPLEPTDDEEEEEEEEEEQKWPQQETGEEPIKPAKQDLTSQPSAMGNKHVSFRHDWTEDDDLNNTINRDVYQTRATESLQQQQTTSPITETTPGKKWSTRNLITNNESFEQKRSTRTIDTTELADQRRSTRTIDPTDANNFPERLMSSRAIDPIDVDDVLQFQGTEVDTAKTRDDRKESEIGEDDSKPSAVEKTKKPRKLKKGASTYELLKKERVQYNYRDAIVESTNSGGKSKRNLKSQKSKQKLATTASVTNVERQGKKQRSGVSRLAKGVRKRLGLTRQRFQEEALKTPTRRPQHQEAKAPPPAQRKPAQEAQTQRTGKKNHQQQLPDETPNDDNNEEEVAPPPQLEVQESQEDVMLRQFYINQIREIFPDAPSSRIESLLKQGNSMRTILVMLGEESFTSNEADLLDEQETAATSPETEPSMSAASSPCSSPPSFFAAMPSTHQNDMLQQVLEIFPEANVKRIEELLDEDRSINIILQVLAEESMELGDDLANSSNVDMPSATTAPCPHHALTA